MTKAKQLGTIAAITVSLLAVGCSNQTDQDAKKVAKFKCEADAVTAKIIQDPSYPALQAELAKLATQEDAMLQLTKKYRDNASPTEQEKFKQALQKAITEGCAKQ